jgi:hypothetical protein
VRRAALAIPLLAGLAALAACGAQAPDLFLLRRSGTIPGARLTLRVTDDGRASCDGRPLVEIPSSQLIAARAVQRDVSKPAKRHLRLPPQPGSVLSYSVRTQDGSVSFSDDSLRQPPVFYLAADLARKIAQGPCHLAR